MIEFLKKDKIDNINIINFIENNPILFFERESNSIVIKGTSDKTWVYNKLKKIKEKLEIFKK
ncbi:MAG: hypothetical protein PF638_10715 [Candidatus Delongbacteria bacterium]|jgi:hypothetical protein|nr:hypothetical protein [Candidatus Delongbacteria bacterium]